MSQKWSEERVSILGEISIGATISYIDKSTVSPAIILVMGTGKTDRDGNQKGFRLDFYKNLAKVFVNNGFVCIRYDKRGTYETEGNYDTAGLSDLTHDAIAVAKFAKSLPFVDDTRVIVCGHSEGAMIATLLSEQEDIAGLLLLGGAAMSMEDALLYQNHLLAEEAGTKKGLLGLILRRQTTGGKADLRVKALFQKCRDTDKERVFWGGAIMNAKWLREHGSYTSKSFVDILEKYKKPVLAITGTADRQADYKSLDALAEIPHIQTYAPQGINHILRLIDDDNSMLTVQKQYKRLAKQPLYNGVEQLIEKWLHQFKGGL